MNVRLRDIAKVSAGQAAPKVFSNEGLPFVRAGHLNDLINGRKLNSLPKVPDSEAIKKRLKKIPKGSILFAKSGMSATKNRVYVTEEETYFVSHLAAVLPNQNFAPSFLAKFISWYNPSKLILDSAYPSIRLEDINNLQIPLPPLETQKHIAQILDDAAALRDKTAQLLKEYDLLAQSIFLDMFGDPVGNPKNLNKISLSEIGHISSGSTPSRKNSTYYGGHIPWVKTGEVKGSLINDTEEKITEEAVNNSSCRIYEKGSIIIAMYGQGKTRGQIGMLGIPATTNQACAVIPPSSKMNYAFLFQLLKLSYNDLRSLGRGGNQPNLNAGLVKNYQVLNPPIELQNQFAEKINLIEQQKELAKQELKESKNLFNCLLQKAFKGELV